MFEAPKNVTAFSSAVVEKLGYYVYLLRDPETKEIFYVGKGMDNRIFAHINAAITDSPDTAKLERIRAIHARGQEVLHTIHRHGLTEKEAFEVEAALIDLLGLTELTNLISGYDVLRGAKSIAEINEMYDAPLITITEAAILVMINRLYYRSMPADELYAITQGDWVIGARRERAAYVFAISNGIVRQVYGIERWHSAQPVGEFNPRIRWRFDGYVAKEMQHYVGGSVARYLTIGAQNPIRYVNC